MAGRLLQPTLQKGKDFSVLSLEEEGRPTAAGSTFPPGKGQPLSFPGRHSSGEVVHSVQMSTGRQNR